MKNANQSNYLSQVEQIASVGLDVGLQLTLDGGSVPHETLPTETVKETVAIFKQHKQLKSWLKGGDTAREISDLLKLCKNKI